MSKPLDKACRDVESLCDDLWAAFAEAELFPAMDLLSLWLTARELQRDIRALSEHIEIQKETP